MKVKEIIQRVRNEYSKGIESDDIRLSARLVYNIFLSVRNNFLRKRYNSKQNISINDVTAICIEFEKVKGEDCCGMKLNCEVMKSRKKVPNILENLYGLSVLRAGNLIGTRDFNYIKLEQLKYQQYFRYAKNTIKYTLKDGYIYIFGKDLPEKGEILAVLENPLEYKGCTKTNDCESYLDKNFPIDTTLLDDIINKTTLEVFNYFGKGINDIHNDSRESDR